MFAPSNFGGIRRYLSGNSAYGDNAIVALDRYEFDTVDSQRLRLGARLDWQFSTSASVHVGAAWEHEFNGEAWATTYGMERPAPTMEGDTGVFDLGLSFTSAPNLTMEAGLTGCDGMRQGTGGNVLVKYNF